CSRIMAAGFFFSSRRRHTRFSRDWSSDVCSSDLIAVLTGRDIEFKLVIAGVWLSLAEVPIKTTCAQVGTRHTPFNGFLDIEDARSEERRVGKEGRARRAQDRGGKTQAVVGSGGGG